MFNIPMGFLILNTLNHSLSPIKGVFPSLKTLGLVISFPLSLLLPGQAPVT